MGKSTNQMMPQQRSWGDSNGKHLALRVMAVLTLAFTTWISSIAPAQAASQSQIDQARDKAAAWLILNQQGDGLWTNNGGTEISVSGQALLALLSANVKGFPVLNGNAWLLNNKAESVDALSRVLLARAMSSINQTAGFQTLLTWKNSDLASVDLRLWGSYPQYTTSFTDTALAWRAILSMSYDLTNLQLPLVNTLCNTLPAQRPDGGWGLNLLERYQGGLGVPTGFAAGSVLSTSQMMLMLNQARTRYPLNSAVCGVNNTDNLVVTSIRSAVTWLTTTARNGDGGVGENGASSNIATALAYLALQTVASTSPADYPVAVTGASALLDYMVTGGRQAANGSWNGDPMVTALMLEALSKIALPAVDSDGDGIPDSIKTAMVAIDPTAAASRALANRKTGAGQPGITLPIVIANIPLNTFYSGNVSVSGGTAPYTWTVTGGGLPPGLALGTFAGATATISGTPTALGPYVFEYTVRDNNGATNKTIAEINVVRAAPGNGDVNGDGKVDLADVLLAQRFALGLATPNAQQKAQADVAPAGEPDGVIDASDVLRILRKALGIDNF